jgi:hypothetical protein
MRDRKEKKKKKDNSKVLDKFIIATSYFEKQVGCISTSRCG